MANKAQAWQVTAPSRLHFGFIGLKQQAKRRFGSIGVALQSPVCRISLHRADHLEVIADTHDEVHRLIERFDNAYQTKTIARIEVLESIPRHSGLGSGTQLALAVGHLLSFMHDLRLTSREIAISMQRGSRSGIGIAAFDYGGFIIDGGKGSVAAPPVVIANPSFPKEWRIVLIFDHQATQGLHGEHEKSAFDKLLQVATPSAAELSHLVLMQILPALVESDYDGFAEALGQFQQLMGDYFAALQGGRYNSTAVASVLGHLLEQDIKAVGQSSWGPTGYVIAKDKTHASDIQSSIRRRVAEAGDISQNQIEVVETSVNATGSTINPIV